MRRMVIFQHYSYFDEVEDYVYYVLNSFKIVAEKIVFISNSKLNDIDLNKINKIVDECYQRENIGYDAGAFKDYFLNMSYNELKEWDEILLTNSTYLGPLFSWNDVFNKMSNLKVNFWGLSRHCGGEYTKYFGQLTPEHIQSYFILLKKEIFLTEDFYVYWKEMAYPRNFKEAVTNFEFTFTSYWMERGFVYDTYLEQCDEGKMLTSKGGVVFEGDYAEMIVNCGFPIVKYKFVDVAHYEQAVKILQYVRNNTKFNEQLIKAFISKLENTGILPFDRKALLESLNKKDDIYIWGHGLYAKNISSFLKDNDIYICKYVVTKPQNKEEILIDQIDTGKDFKLLICVGRTVWKEVKEDIFSKVDRKNIITFYEDAI